jgi:hypothetical protein
VAAHLRITHNYKIISSKPILPLLEKPMALIVNGKDALDERKVVKALHRGVNWIDISKVIQDVGSSTCPFKSSC